MRLDVREGQASAKPRKTRQPASAEVASVTGEGGMSGLLLLIMIIIVNGVRSY